jgi:hypothetical protein
MNKTVIPAVILLAGLFQTTIASEPADAIDKSRFTMLNPTPREFLRPLSADRPDLTESPFTVDAGRFQLEMDLAAFSYDRHNPERADVRVRSWHFGIANLKLGLLNDLDVHLLIPSYSRVRLEERSTGLRQTHSGFGDVVARAKLNLWGNGGSTAFAVMPFVKFPTADTGLGNNAYEGGISFPFAAELPRDWSIGWMTQMDVARDEFGGGYHPEFINTIALGRSLIGNLDGYVEFFSLVSTERDSPWIGSIGLGLTYAINADLQLDGGVNIGVTRAADDWNPFIGLTWRF